MVERYPKRCLRTEAPAKDVHSGPAAHDLRLQGKTDRDADRVTISDAMRAILIKRAGVQIKQGMRSHNIHR